MDIADHWLFSSGNRYVLATNRKLKVTTPRPNLALQAAAYHEAGSRPGRRNLGVVLRSRCTYYAYRFTAASQHWISTLRKSPPLTASRISFPVIGTMSVSSRLPRSISFVTVEVNPFHEIKKPRLHRRLRFSIFSRKITTSSFPHLPVQFLHSAKSRADSRRRRGSLLSFTIEMSISSVAVRTAATYGKSWNSFKQPAAQFLKASALVVSCLSFINRLYKRVEAGRPPTG